MRLHIVGDPEHCMRHARSVIAVRSAIRRYNYDLMWRTAAVLVVCWSARPGISLADGSLLGDDTWRYRSAGALVVDGGLTVGFPTALSTGLATGVGLGVSHGTTLAWGARASWQTATESSLVWTVTHRDFKLRVTGEAKATAGRGTLGLRAGLGGTLVHESRLRNQGMRAGLSGDELQSTALRLLPAADLDAVIALHVFGPWLLVTTGGPSVAVLDGGLHASWTAQLGVAWQP
jgi:hypothetical protein